MGKRRRMEKEEIKRRVAAGIENRRKQGLLRPITKPIKTHAVGPHLTKTQRAKLNGHTTIAIAALCQSDRLDYLGAATAIWKILISAGYSTEVAQEYLRGVSNEAAMGEAVTHEILDQQARKWLYDEFRTKDSIILLPGKGLN